MPEDQIKRAIRVATEAAKHAPDEFKEACFATVLRVELESSLEARAAIPAQPRKGTKERRSESQNLDAFLKDKQPSNDRETALVIMYYREEHQGAKDTGKDDLDAAFKEVARGRMKRINDPGQTLRDAKRDGYADSKDRGVFFLTNKGKKLVEEQLPHNRPAPDGKT